MAIIANSPQTVQSARPRKDLLPRSWFVVGGEFAHLHLSPTAALARVFGRAGAALLNQIHYRLQKSPLAQDGQHWALFTAEQWGEQINYCDRTIKRAIKRLREKGVLLAAQGLGRRWLGDRRNSCAIDYENLVATVATALRPKGHFVPLQGDILAPSSLSIRKGLEETTREQPIVVVKNFVLEAEEEAEQQQTPAPAKPQTPITSSDQTQTPISQSDQGGNPSGPGEKFYSWAAAQVGFDLNATHRAAAARCCIEHGHQAIANAVQAVREKISGGKCDNPLAALTAALTGCWEPREKPPAPADTTRSDWMRLAIELGVIQAGRQTAAGGEVLAQGSWEPIEIMMSAWPWRQLLQHPNVSQQRRVDTWYIALCQRYAVEPLTSTTPAYGPPPASVKLFMAQLGQK